MTIYIVLFVSVMMNLILFRAYQTANYWRNRFLGELRFHHLVVKSMSKSEFDAWMKRIKEAHNVR